MAEQQRLAARQAEKVDWSSAEFEKGRAAAGARERIVVREVEHVVERYRAGDQQCLDPDGVRIIAADVDASNAGRELAPALPASAAAR